MNYAEYISSDRWRERRAQWFRVARKNGKALGCRGCAAAWRQGFHLHHRTYDRMGGERHSDLILLCEPCHVKLHQHAQQSGLTVESATNSWLAGAVLKCRRFKEGVSGRNQPKGKGKKKKAPFVHRWASSTAVGKRQRATPQPQPRPQDSFQARAIAYQKADQRRLEQTLAKGRRAYRQRLERNATP